MATKTWLPRASIILAALFLLADVTSAAVRPIPSLADRFSRKLLEAPRPAPVVSDYADFCVEQDSLTRQATYLAGFDTTTLYVAINTCGGEVIRVVNTTTDVYSPMSTGTVTQASIPGGRTISWHVEGSGVFAFIVDALFDPTTSARFDQDTFDEFSNLFLGTRPNDEGFVAAGLSEADLQGILATATFVWDFSFAALDGSMPGDPYSVGDLLSEPTNPILRDDMTATISGPLRSTPNLHYPLGNPAVASFKQVNAGPQGDGPFDFPGSGESAIQTEFFLNVLSPTESGAGAAALITQVTGNTPRPTTAAPAPPPEPTSEGFKVGTVCDPSSDLPNQCFAANGQHYVCCPGGCPSDPSDVPRCR